jgi:hypothetical protein
LGSFDIEGECDYDVFLNQHADGIHEQNDQAHHTHNTSNQSLQSDHDPLHDHHPHHLLSCEKAQLSSRSCLFKTGKINNSRRSIN